MLVILLVVFVFCWTPAHVLELIPVFDKEHEVSDRPKLLDPLTD